MVNRSICSLRALGLAVFLLALAAGSQAHAQGPNGGQALIQVGGFQIQFWEPGDGGGVGAVRPLGVPTTPDANLGTFSAAERASVVRSFEYWTQKLNLPANQGAEAPIIRIAKDIAAPNFNANAVAQDRVIAGVRRSNVYDRLVNGRAAARDASGVDGSIVLTPGSTGGVLNVLNNDKMRQLSFGGGDTEAVFIHEIAHLLGYTGRHTPFTNRIFLGRFFGPNTAGITGLGIPISGDRAHTNLEFHNHTRGQPFGISYRNLQPFSPGELTPLDDMIDPVSGLSYDVSGAFGRAFYSNGLGLVQNIATGFNSTDDYTYGLFLFSDNRNIVQNGSFNQSGYAATGVRIAGSDTAPLGNRVTIGAASTLNINGDFGIGILASSGANHDIRVQGAINANGTGGRGAVIDFGPNVLSPLGIPDVTSVNYGAPLVDDFDVTGSISGTDAAIEIGSGAAVNEVNLMNGASLTGDIVSNAITGAGLPDRPTLTLGKTAAADGSSIDVGDAAFSINLMNTIRGSNPFDINQFAGDTNAGGSWLVNNVLIQAGIFRANGNIFANQFTSNNGSTLAGSGAITGNVTANGDVSPGNSIGRLTVNGTFNSSPTATFSIESINGGESPEPGVHVDTINVQGTANINGGSVTAMSNSPHDTGGYYRFVTSNNLNIIQLPTFTSNIPLTATQRAKLVVANNDLGFAILRSGPLSPFARTPNEVSFTNYFDQVRLNANLVDIRDNLDILTDPNDIRHAINQMTGDIYGTTPRMSLYQTSNEMRFLAQSVGGIHVRPAFSGGARRALSTNGQYIVRGQGPANGGGSVLGSFYGGQALPYYDTWISGFGVTGLASSDGNATAVRNSASGTRFGGTRWLNSNFRTGFFGSFGRMNVNRSDPNQSVSGDNFLAGAFLHFQSEMGYWLLAGGGGGSQFESNRNVSFGLLNELNQGNFNGSQGVVFFEKGWHYGLGSMEFRPAVSLQYVHVAQDGFSETGGITALDVSSTSADSLRSNVGLRLSGNYFRPDGARFSPFFRGSWQHEFLDTGSSITSGFAAATPPTFVAQGINFGRNWGILGGGVEFAPNQEVQFHLGYDALFNNRQVAHSGNVTMELNW